MTKPEKRGNFKVSREEWITEARKTLIKEGIAGVKVERLAKKLGVTRGGFYWFFKSRNDLLDSLLEDWEQTNTAPLFNAVENAGPDGQKQFDQLVRAWITEKSFSPAYDAAMRDWARTSATARTRVERIDDKRIGLLTDIFRRMGYDDEEAFIRGRITYFRFNRSSKSFITVAGMSGWCERSGNPGQPLSRKSQPANTSV